MQLHCFVYVVHGTCTASVTDHEPLQLHVHCQNNTRLYIVFLDCILLMVWQPGACMYSVIHVHLLLQCHRRRNRGGGRGLEPLCFEKWGGAEPPHFSNVCTLNILLKSLKLLSEGLRSTLWRSKIPNFPGGACPQTPLDSWWFSSLKPEPPHYCRGFSALEMYRILFAIDNLTVSKHLSMALLSWICIHNPLWWQPLTRKHENNGSCIENNRDISWEL